MGLGEGSWSGEWREGQRRGGVAAGRVEAKNGRARGRVQHCAQAPLPEVTAGPPSLTCQHLCPTEDRAGVWRHRPQERHCVLLALQCEGVPWNTAWLLSVSLTCFVLFPSVLSVGASEVSSEDSF